MDLPMVFGLSMVRGFKVSILWSMASPWNYYKGLFVLILIWSHFTAILVICTTFFPFMQRAEFLLCSLWHMFCNLVFCSAISRLFIIHFLDTVCGVWWLSVPLLGSFGFPLGSGHGFPLSRACCWSGPRIAYLLATQKVCDVKRTEVLQPHYSFALIQAHDEILLMLSTPEACVDLFVFCWNWWICPLPLLCCSGEKLIWLVLWDKYSRLYMHHFFPFLGCLFSYSRVWRLLVQLFCSYGPSFGSSLGSFFSWACCRRVSHTLCPLFSISLCVANSLEFRQHLAFLAPAQDDRVFDNYLSEASSWVFPYNWVYSLISTAMLCQRLVADCLLELITFSSYFCFSPLDCNVIVFFWYALDCNTAIRMCFIGSGGAIYVLFKLFSAHCLDFCFVLFSFVRMLDFHFIFVISLFWSLSMVRGHKALALWPMASPRNIIFAHLFSCIVQSMGWTFLLRYFDFYAHVGLQDNLFSFFVALGALSLFSLYCTLPIGSKLEFLLFSGLSQIRLISLTFSFKMLGTILRGYLYHLYL